MSTCLGCPCVRPSGDGEPGSRLLLSTRVAHTLALLRRIVREAGAQILERGPGVLEVVSADLTGLLAALSTGLSSVEAAEVRALRLADEQGEALLAAAFGAPNLAQAAARTEHVDLLAMFADERAAFRSVYQPIVRLDGTPDPQVIGYEALLRALGPGGQVQPLELFGAAEAAGWLHVLDRIGRTSALRGASGWLGDALLFVNFLPTTIYRPEVCLATTEWAAQQAGLRLDQLVFEVTESERVTDLAHLDEVFAYYRARGCQVALDDLGAGYSSLNLLVRLQPDIVKLDKELVQRLPDQASSAVVKAVVEITHAYGGQVLAECVETAEQAGAATDLGVDLGQGWHFGRPQDPPSGVRERPRAASVRPRSSLQASSFSGDDAAVALVLDSPARGTADVEALLSTALRLTTVGVTIADATVPDLPLIFVNEAFETMTGYRAAEVLGRNCRFLQPPGVDPAVRRELGEALREGRDHLTVLPNVDRAGRAWWNELRVSPVHDSQGRLTHYFGFQNDVTARVEAQAEVLRLAHYDHLTGLLSRARLLELLEQAVTTATQEGRRLAVLFFDLDGFKAINDAYGHDVGDLALTAAAACMRGALREPDLMARYSGDEFVAVCFDVPPGSGQQVAQRTADAVLGSLHNPVDVGGSRVQLGASVGVACFPEHGGTAGELLRAADVAMYQAKGRRDATRTSCGLPARS